MTKRPLLESKPPKGEMSFDEALSRFLKVTPEELAEKIAEDTVPRAKEVRARIDQVKKDIDNAGRPKKGRFSL